MSLSREDREEITQLVTTVAQASMRQFARQRREYIRLCLLLMEQLNKLDDDLGGLIWALSRGDVLSPDDLASAKDARTAEMAGSAQAEKVWRSMAELNQLANELAREAEEDEQK